MEITVREERSIVEIWLRGHEEGAGLGELYAWCRERGYLAVVYRSGAEDLADLTAGLLVHNRQALAVREP